VTAKFRYAFDDVAHLRSLLVTSASVLTLSATAGCFAARAAAPNLSSAFSFCFRLKIMKLHEIRLIPIFYFGMLKLFERFYGRVSIVDIILRS